MHGVSLTVLTLILTAGPNDPPARTVDEAIQAMRVRPGFTVELAVAEPMVMDPIDLAWGPDGKLWVVEMADYPLGLDGKWMPGGRVRFLEDTDGDGRYDKSTLFLDRLRFPSGILPWRDGLIVLAEPLLFYAEDRDGDGRADFRETLITDFAGNLPLRRVNYPRLGLDNWIYLANGASQGSVRSEKTGQVADYRGRDLRIRPDSGLVEAESGPTQWGRSRDDWGNWFGNNNSNPGFHFPLPDHYLRRNPHVRVPPMRVDLTDSRDVYPTGPVVTHCFIAQPTPLQGHPGRWTSACGTTIYRDGLFGPDFVGNYFVADSVYNVVHRMILSPRGASFEGRRAEDEQRSEFLTSLDPWFRPTGARTGPDGALWVIDMCRLVIEHPNFIVDELEATLNLRAGEDLGRIWRILPEDKTPRPIPRLDHLSTPELVAALDSPNGWQRDTAQLMLLWRGGSAAKAPLERTVLTHRRPLTRLHAICTLEGLGLLEEQIVATALRDEHPGVRRHALRLSEPFLNSSPTLGPKLLALLDDLDAQIQLQLAFSLGEWDDPRAGEALGMLAARHADDNYLSAAAMSSAVGHLEEMIAVVLDDSNPSNNRIALVRQLLDTAVACEQSAPIAAVLRPVTTADDNGRFANWQFRVMRQLLDGLDRRSTTLLKFSQTAPPAVAQAVRQTDALFEAARRRVRNEAAALADRQAAVHLLGRGLSHQSEDLATLAELLGPFAPVELQRVIVQSMGRLNCQAVPELLLQPWYSIGPQVQGAILDVLLSRSHWAEILLDQAAIRPGVATAFGATRRELLLNHPLESVRARAVKVFGERDAGEEIKALLEKYAPVVDLAGDPVRGKDVFVAATCADCHQLGDVGNDAGGDLKALVDKSPQALLIATLDPNQSVEGTFIQYIAITTDGLTRTGILAEETGISITLLDSKAEPHVILRKDLDELVSTGRSHMPEGLAEKFDVQQAADLFAFIAESGPACRVFPGNQPELIRPNDDGSLQLLASKAEIHGDGIAYSQASQSIDAWTEFEALTVWTIEITREGPYEVWLNWACENDAAGNRFFVRAGEAEVFGRVAGTGTSADFLQMQFGQVDLAPGTHRLEFGSFKTLTGRLIGLREIRLVPIEAE